MKYNQKIVEAVFQDYGLPMPLFEFRFCPHRLWRFDLAWPEYKVALEVQGGIWTGGRHVRGKALLREWEKLNAAACLGWRVMFCQPEDLLMQETLCKVKLAAFAKEGPPYFFR